MFSGKQIIVINGPAQSGKDAFIDLCRQTLDPFGVQVHTLSSITQIKEWAKMMGWDEIKDEKGRKFLADLKELSINFNNGPTRYLIENIERIDSGIIFVHIREPEEIHKLKKIYSELACTLHIYRPGIETFENQADSRTNELHYDYYIDNDGDLNKLALTAARFLESFIEARENNEIKLR